MGYELSRFLRVSKDGAGWLSRAWETVVILKIPMVTSFHIYGFMVTSLRISSRGTKPRVPENLKPGECPEKKSGNTESRVINVPSISPAI